LLGRGFTREEEKPGTRVVVLSHDLWQSAFHGDRSIIGRAITIYKDSYTVVGWQSSIQIPTASLRLSALHQSLST